MLGVWQRNRVRETAAGSRSGSAWPRLRRGWPSCRPGRGTPRPRRLTSGWRRPSSTRPPPGPPPNRPSRPASAPTACPPRRTCAPRPDTTEPRPPGPAPGENTSGKPPPTGRRPRRMRGKPKLCRHCWASRRPTIRAGTRQTSCYGGGPVLLRMISRGSTAMRWGQRLPGEQPAGGLAARFLGVAELAHLDDVPPQASTLDSAGETPKPFGRTGQSGAVHLPAGPGL